MGIGDSIGKAAENAMEDLAQTSDPTDDAHVPEPGASDEDIQVHSSISEGSNARDGDDGPQQSGRTTYTPQARAPRRAEAKAHPARQVTKQPSQPERRRPAASARQAPPTPPKQRAASPARRGFPNRIRRNCGQILPRGTRTRERDWGRG
jgi:hypothetical protein